MADMQYIRPNRLREAVRRYHYRLLAIGTILVFCTPFVSLFLIIPGLVVLCWFAGRADVRLIGARGEDMALGIPLALPGSLATLSNDYVVFNQIRVPVGKSFRELDKVVLGSNGIFTVEVKHLRGAISGSGRDGFWRQRKRSRAGKVYEQDIRNPVSQVQGAAYALHKYLAARGVHTRVEGIVVFTHPQCQLTVRSSPVPVLPLPALAGFIRHFRPKRAPARLDVTLQALIELSRDDSLKPPKPRKGWLSAFTRLRPSHPQHIKYFMRDVLDPRKKIEDIMNHDYKKAAPTVCASPALALVPAPVVPPPLPPAPVAGNRPQPPVQLKVIPGGRPEETRAVTRIREVRIIVYRNIFYRKKP